MKLPAPHTRAATVVQHLAMGPASSADLGELTNQTLADVGSFMNELRKRGLVERVGGQKAPSGMTMAVWALTDACRAAYDPFNGREGGSDGQPCRRCLACPAPLMSGSARTTTLPFRRA
jgi:hypothetical protein